MPRKLEDLLIELQLKVKTLSIKIRSEAQLLEK